MVRAYEVQGYFEPMSGKEEIIKQGDFFKGVIRLWPFPNAEIEEFQSLEGEQFLRLFTLVEVEKFGYSSNNPDVLEVEGTFVLENIFKPGEFYIWEYRDLNIPIDIRNIIPKEHIIKDDKFIIFNQEAEGRRKDLGFVLISLAIFSGLLIFEYFRFKKRKAKQELVDQQFQQQVNYWKKIFTDAEERKDFEDIYKYQNQWMKIIGVKTPPMLDFFRAVKTHQYKRDWASTEQEEIKSSFEQIRGIFN